MVKSRGAPIKFMRYLGVRVDFPMFRHVPKYARKWCKDKVADTFQI